MKVKRLIGAIIAIAIASMLLNGCMSRKESGMRHISETLSIDCSSAELISKYDSHGGFHGDGTSFYELRFRDTSQVTNISGSDDWNEFPLSDNAASLIWGLQTEYEDASPLVTKDNDWDNPLFPKVEHGYWFFLDRHSYATDPKDDSHVLDSSRPSFNFTVAIYDTDSNTLYYSEFDT